MDEDKDPKYLCPRPGPRMDGQLQLTGNGRWQGISHDARYLGTWVFFANLCFFVVLKHRLDLLYFFWGGSK